MQIVRLIIYLDIYIYAMKHSVKYFILLYVFHITLSEHIFISLQMSYFLMRVQREINDSCQSYKHYQVIN